MTRNAQFAAFHEWRGKVADLREWTLRVAIASRFLRAIRDKAAFRAFARWRDVVKTNAARRLTALRVAARISRDAFADAFYRWVSLLDAKRAWSAKMARCDRFVSSMGRRSLRAAFNRWMEMSLERGALRRRLASALARFSDGRLRAAFAGWVAKAEDARRFARTLDAVSRRWRAAIEASAWRSLVEAVEGRRRVERVGLRFVRALEHRLARRAFTEWTSTCRFASDAAADREATEKAVRKMARRKPPRRS